MSSDLTTASEVRTSEGQAALSLGLLNALYPERVELLLLRGTQAHEHIDAPTNSERTRHTDACTYVKEGRKHVSTTDG